MLHQSFHRHNIHKEVHAQPSAWQLCVDEHHVNTAALLYHDNVRRDNESMLTTETRRSGSSMPTSTAVPRHTRLLLLQPADCTAQRYTKLSTSKPYAPYCNHTVDSRARNQIEQAQLACDMQTNRGYEMKTMNYGTSSIPESGNQQMP
jgi:hypothetical protein